MKRRAAGTRKKTKKSHWVFVTSNRRTTNSWGKKWYFTNKLYLIWVLLKFYDLNIFLWNFLIRSHLTWQDQSRDRSRVMGLTGTRVLLVHLKVGLIENIGFLISNFNLLKPTMQLFSVLKGNFYKQNTKKCILSLVGC